MINYKKHIQRVLMAISVILLTVACAPKDSKIKLYLVGDSTMADKEKLYLPERGWGQMFPEFFTDEVIIENHAKNGRSTRSFIYEGRWDSVYNKLAAGDYIIIQFGHNDEVDTKQTRYATPEEFEYNIRKFVNESRVKGANPILATSVVRRSFDENGQLQDTHGQYPGIIRKVASDLNVPLLDMQKASMELVDSLGVEASKKLYQHYAPGEIDSLPDGKIDDTHFCELGATKMAAIAAQQLKAMNHPLAKYLK